MIHGHYGPAIGLFGSNVKSDKIRKQLKHEAVLVHAMALRDRAQEVLQPAFDQLPVPEKEKELHPEQR